MITAPAIETFKDLILPCDLRATTSSATRHTAFDKPSSSAPKIRQIEESEGLSTSFFTCSEKPMVKTPLSFNFVIAFERAVSYTHLTLPTTPYV